MQNWAGFGRGTWIFLLAIAFLLALPDWAGADGDLPTKFSNQGGIRFTRHNLTQNVAGLNSMAMEAYRNNYGEVCVYCHTPHGANSTAQAPLWNRTPSSATYTTYDQLGTVTLTGSVVGPGPNSLTCLSCHDGTISVDSIINMPGSGGYNPAQATGQQSAWLSTWRNASGSTSGHMKLNATGCLACHSSGASEVGAGATDFTVFAIGTDLKNDHPIGVEFGAAADLKPFDRSNARIAFWDSDGSTRPDSDEVRLYNSGEGFRVECASCHDPHGVPSGGAGSPIIRSFLRKDNAESALCLSCHIK